MKRIVSSIMLLVFLIIVLPGCSALQKLGLQENSDDELRPVSSIIIGEAEANRLTEKIPVRLYFANEDNTKLKLEIRYIGKPDDDKKNLSNLASMVINELIKGPSDEKTFRRTVPEEAKLNSPVSISGKVATVDMSKEFRTKHPGGKDAEKMTIYSIVNSLTELEGIEKVKFTIDGKSQKEFMGNFKFDGVFPRSVQLISKETAETTSRIIEDDSINMDSAAESAVSGKEDLPVDVESIDGLEPLE
jgi:hypothetical protein